ncbi:MAG: 3-phosphoshikimate 1-carboxyvinyltransferase [Flavobacteriales bacterium]|nr:3-phosphoshikimate 1-carboxyvinyltransferase [Flavobacteriales bacterium]
MKLETSNGPFLGEVELPVSKSIANRYLIIAALVDQKLQLPKGIPEDVRVLHQTLESDSDVLNIGMAGTAMRFLTAFFAVQVGKTVTLTGAERMKQRPIGELVDALRILGAEVEYLESEGFPPLRITGKRLKGGQVEVSASVSSQFISALMMIGPMMESGLQINLKGKVLSRPYIELTADCMGKCGVEVAIDGNSISVPTGTYQFPDLNVESDWTSASYFYALAAAKPKSRLLLKGLKLTSKQGDSFLAEWFEKIGVTSVQKENGVEIQSSDEINFPKEIDFIDNPDLAQTFAFLAATLGRPLKLTGLDNLRIKETDRVSALKTELKKLGVSVLIEETTMTVSGSISAEEAYVKSYNDHRMAMSAAVLSAVIPVEIENPEVVAKSFPKFWSSVRW